MPSPGETRTVDGRLQVWIPSSSSVAPKIKGTSHKKTIPVYRQNFDASNERTSILSAIGSGELREIVIIADQKINVIVKADGQDILFGNNQFDNISVTSVNSKFIEARYDDPNYIIGFSGIHFQSSLEIIIWFDTPAIISSIVGLYDVYGDE